jgi:hypothetical protein
MASPSGWRERVGLDKLNLNTEKPFDFITTGASDTKGIFVYNNMHKLFSNLTGERRK